MVTGKLVGICNPNIVQNLDTFEAALVYFYEPTIVVKNNDFILQQSFNKGWYSLNILSDGRASLIPYDLEKNPILVPSEEFMSNDYFDQYTKEADWMDYVITENNVYKDLVFSTDMSTIIEKMALFNNDFGDTYNFIIGFSPFSYQNNTIQGHIGTAPFINDIKHLVREIVTILPAKEVKKIDLSLSNQYQANYAQNDITKPDYIRNRLAWSEMITTELAGDEILENSEIIDGLYVYKGEGSLGLVEGKKYSVSCEGDIYYTGICQSGIDDSNRQYLYIGDPNIINGGTGVCIQDFPGQEFNFIAISSHRIYSISTTEEVVYPVPEKFITPSIAPTIKELENKISDKQDKITASIQNDVLVVARA
jgi:hypothetical protein